MTNTHQTHVESTLRYAARLKATGAFPNILRNCRLKVDRSPNPAVRAIDATGSDVVASETAARLSLTPNTYP